jgi:predicted dehydrogenase
MKQMTVAIIGCGVISQIYLQNLTTRFPNIKVKSCCARHIESARKRAAQFGIEATTMEAILADPEIEMVVVLTPPATHFDIIRQALEAGKHVYTEKVLSLTTREAKQLCDLSDEKGLYLGSAPDTFMGSAWQKSAQIIKENTLGKVTGFDVYINRNMDLIACEYPIVRLAGGGVLYDFGVYHLTALTYLLGRVKEVCGIVENNKPIRIGTVEGTPDFGKEYPFDNEAQVTALLRMENGAVGTFTINGESVPEDLCHLRIYGEQGVLALPNPNFFGGPVRLTKTGAEWEELPNDLPYSDNSRGLGPSEMACSIEEGRTNAASKERALHVLAVMEAIVKSTETKRFEPVQY